MYTLTDGTWTYTWERGRQLKSMTDGDTTWSYSYNADGMRSGRTNGITQYTYVYNNGLLTKMTIGSNVLVFSYDSAGHPATVNFNGAIYYYSLNAQGDVMALINSSGEAIVQYHYDAWGKILSMTGSMGSTLGRYNPLRYRGYVYDQETGLYYLQSRYYNPEICRFISADNQLSADSPIGINLFAYCGNNPVNRVDPTGEAWWHWALGAAVVAACAVATVVTCGGFAAAATAVGLVSSGMAASTTAATVATAAFIGSATVYGTAVVAAAATSDSLQEFCDKGDWGTVASTAGGAVFGGTLGYLASPKQQSQVQPQVKTSHKTGLASPKKVTNPNGTYTQFGSNGKIYSYAQYDSANRQTMRIDFQGRPHKGVLPHIHVYFYPEEGRRSEFVYDLMWNLIDRKG